MTAGDQKIGLNANESPAGDGGTECAVCLDDTLRTMVSESQLIGGERRPATSPWNVQPPMTAHRAGGNGVGPPEIPTTRCPIPTGLDSDFTETCRVNSL